VVFLLLFSFVDPGDAEAPPNEATEEEPQPSWMVSLIAEEIRQIFDRNKVSALEKLKDWFAHAWDVFDLVLNLMMISCILVRVFVTEEYFVWVRMTYALTLTMFYIRFMQFYLIHQTLGPKVVMVTRMINDTVFFFAILVVFLLAYGVAAQALLYPNSPLSWKLIKDVVYLPYWQMYGELQLGDILADDDKPPIMPSNVTGRGFEGGGEGEESEAVHSPLVIVLFAFYMLITNVLLLNLLIAMFQHTFDLVQESSRKALIFEFHHRPFLCHPLTVLCHIANVLERLWRAACGRKGTDKGRL
uniref:Ion_trans domain-containing protein n=1 Tax=Macrostomum lignano TaxID=282301 RepID=A0A1I8FK99_9PLAT